MIGPGGFMAAPKQSDGETLSVIISGTAFTATLPGCKRTTYT